MIINRPEVIKNMLNQKRIELEAKDLEILKTRQKKYVPVKIKIRTLTTEFGQLTYKRRIYKKYNLKKQKWEYISLLDEELGIKKWQKLDQDLIQKIERQITSNKRYVDIVDMFSDIQLSQMTISNIFKRMIVDNHLKVKKIELAKNQIVYVNIDDTFPIVRKNQKRIMLKTRVITFNLGLNSQTRRLINKRFSFIFGNSNSEFVASQIIKIGNKFFKNFDNCKLVIGGDGARWIRSTSDFLGASYVLDKYHALKILSEAFHINWHFPKRKMEDWKLYNEARSYFNKGDYENLIKMVDASNYKAAQKYFRFNKSGVISYSKSWNIGVSAESDVSKLVKSTYGYGSKIYSYKVFKKILIQKSFIYNQI